MNNSYNVSKHTLIDCKGFEPSNDFTNQISHSIGNFDSFLDFGSCPFINHLVPFDFVWYQFFFRIVVMNAQNFGDVTTFLNNNFNFYFPVILDFVDSCVIGILLAINSEKKKKILPI